MKHPLSVVAVSTAPLLALVALVACGADPAPPTITPAAPGTSSMPIASVAPPPPAVTTAPSAGAAPAEPKVPSVAEIMATVPDKAGKITLERGLVITIDGQGRVIIEDPNGKLGGSSSCGPNGFEYKKAVLLFAELQDALRKGARDEVQNLVLYPLRINEGGGKHRMVNDAAALERDFGAVFADKVVAKILAAEPRAVFCRADGFMFGDGMLWAETKKGKYGIFVINP